MMTDDEKEDFFKCLESFGTLMNLTEDQKIALAQSKAKEAAAIRQDVKELVNRHGAVPPPWIYAENSHPMSIRWRMGGGEWHIMVFSQWWKQSQMDEADRIAYFKKWPPPPRWMEWMASAIWELKPWEHEGGFDYSPYFAKLQAAGFEGVSEFEADFNDEKWLRLEGDSEQAEELR